MSGVSHGITLDSIDAPRPQVYVVFSPLFPKHFYIGSTYRRLISQRFAEELRDSLHHASGVRPSRRCPILNVLVVGGEHVNCKIHVRPAMEVAVFL